MFTKASSILARKTGTFLTIVSVGMTLSACGNAGVNARLEPGETALATPVSYSAKTVTDRTAILVALLGTDMPKTESDRVARLAFFTSIASAVVETMTLVEAERAEVLEYSADLSEKIPVPAKLDGDITALIARYKARNAADLLTRIDVIPLDMLLTQASVESEWGESPVSHDCKNIFGIHAASSAQACAKHPILAAYPDYSGSIERYVLLLNSGSAYGTLRRERAKQRTQVGEDGALNSSTLVDGLLPYSERGEAYVDQIVAGVREYGLDKVYDDYMKQAY